MNALILLAVLVAGVAIGLFFFGGLWYTTQKAVRSSSPAAWFLVSFVLRVAVTVILFYLIGGGIWLRFVLCVAGFIIGRLIVVRLTRTAQGDKTKPKTTERETI